MLDIFFSFFSSFTTCFVPHLQLPNPCVDQDSLSWTGGATQHSLAQQRSVLWDLQWVEVYAQILLAACVVFLVDLVHDTLQERVALDEESSSCKYVVCLFFVYLSVK